MQVRVLPGSFDSYPRVLRESGARRHTPCPLSFRKGEPYRGRHETPPPAPFLLEKGNPISERVYSAPSQSAAKTTRNTPCANDKWSRAPKARLERERERERERGPCRVVRGGLWGFWNRSENFKVANFFLGVGFGCLPWQTPKILFLFDSFSS